MAFFNPQMQGRFGGGGNAPTPGRFGGAMYGSFANSPMGGGGGSPYGQQQPQVPTQGFMGGIDGFQQRMTGAIRNTYGQNPQGTPQPGMQNQLSAVQSQSPYGPPPSPYGGNSGAAVSDQNGALGMGGGSPYGQMNQLQAMRSRFGGGGNFGQPMPGRFGGAAYGSFANSPMGRA